MKNPAASGAVFWLFPHNLCPAAFYWRRYMAKVLLVEDDLTMVNLLQTFLQIEGFDTASIILDGDILGSIKQHNPDVILLDVHLKGVNGIDIDGFELLKKMREIDQLSQTKVIMASGLDVSEKCAQAGTDGFLLKPYMPDNLIQLIKKFV
jgi:CheY-like chemotaxis protein